MRGRQRTRERPRWTSRTYSRKDWTDIPSPHNLILEIIPTRLPHRLNHIQHAHPFPLAEIERPVQTVLFRIALGENVALFNSVKREDVSVREVHDVEIVTHASAVAV